jgi:acyl carrier protein
MSSADIDFLVDYLRSRRPELDTIDPDLDLIENRILDSLGFVNFLYLLEERTGREIDLESVTPDDFRTLRKLARRFFSDHA